MGRKKNVKLIKKPPKASVRMRKIQSGRDQEVVKVLIKHQDLRDLATKGWSKRNKPKFPRFVKRKRGGATYGVKVQAPNAEGASISVYRMLNDARHGTKATRVRKVILSAGYQNKTIPRRFGLFGKGGTILRTKSGRPVIYKKGFDGIEAREWDRLANLVLEPELTEGLKRGYRNGFRNL